LDRQAIRAKQLQAVEKLVDFNKKLLRYSSATNYTDVLTSEQNVLSAQIERVNDHLQQWQAVIALYRSLGGGAKLSEFTVAHNFISDQKLSCNL